MTKEEVEYTAFDLIEDCNHIHPEYLRAICELVADLCPQGEEGHAENAVKFAKRAGANQDTINKMYS